MRVAVLHGAEPPHLRQQQRGEPAAHPAMVGGAGWSTTARWGCWRRWEKPAPLRVEPPVSRPAALGRVCTRG